MQLVEPQAQKKRPGAHLLKHQLSDDGRRRAAAELGGTDDAAAAAVVALRQVCVGGCCR